MNSFEGLVNDIRRLGYVAYVLNRTIEVKADELDDECVAILWLSDSTIMADMGSSDYPLCDLTDSDRYDVLARFLEDPWGYADSVSERDLPY